MDAQFCVTHNEFLCNVEFCGFSHGFDHFMNGDVRRASPRNDVDMESDTMDEHMAALVLTSLSCSPTSPVFANGAVDHRGMLILIVLAS